MERRTRSGARPCGRPFRSWRRNNDVIQLSEVLLMKTKTIKTPSMGLKLLVSFCAKCHDSVVKSQLLRHSHTTRHNHWDGSSPQKEKPRFAKKPFFSVRSRFSWFFLSEKESLKGLTAWVVRLSGCLHTSRISTHGVNILTRVSLSERGFSGFC